MAVGSRSYRMNRIWIQLQIVSFIMIQLIHRAVSQTVLTSDVPTDPICPDTPVEFTCTVENSVVLRWLVNIPDEVLLIQYVSAIPAITMTLPGIEPELTSALPSSHSAGVFNYESTLRVSNSSVLGDNNNIRCDAGTKESAARRTVKLRSPPVAPQFTCTLPGEGTLRLNWMDTGDAVTEYRDCVCDGAGCSCTPSMQCGNTSVCERNLAAGRVQTFSFTAVNCGNSQESSVSTLTTAGADVPAAPVFSEVRVRYDQSTGGLKNIMATWNRMSPSDVVIGCSDEIGIQYTITCDGSSLVDVNTNCDSSLCQYMDNNPPSLGCTLSVTARNAVGMATSTSSIEGMSQTVLTSDVPTDPICPDTPVEFTCTVENSVVLRWLVNIPDEVLLIQYVSAIPAITMTLPGIEPELTSALPSSRSAGVFNYESTLRVSNSSVLGDNNSIRCDAGTKESAARRTVKLRSPPMAPQLTCTLPGEGILRLNWMDTGDAVTEYRDCVCDGAACSCVPSMQCGSTSVCERNLAAGRVQTLSFTALNCGDQESSVSTLTTAGASAPAVPVLSEVRVRYDQSTGGLMNIMATWNRMTPTVVVTGCNDLIGIQYTITCGGSSLVDLNMNCDSSTCWYMDNGPPSSGCTLSVAVRNAVGMATSTSTILDTTPLTVEVSDGTITCRDFSSCVIVYGTAPNNRNLTAVSGQPIPGLLPDVTYFYLVTQTINSQEVEVGGSFTLAACLCSDLIDEQLDPLPTCSNNINGGTIPGAISNGGATYTSLAINSGRAIYQCDEGFSISGDNPRECRGDGSWSGSPPTCLEEGGR